MLVTTDTTNSSPLASAVDLPISIAEVIAKYWLRVIPSLPQPVSEIGVIRVYFLNLKKNYQQC
jgi:hypothetical protein